MRQAELSKFKGEHSDENVVRTHSIPSTLPLTLKLVFHVRCHLAVFSDACSQFSLPYHFRFRLRSKPACVLRYVPRNSKSGHQLIQNTWAGILSVRSG